MAKKTSKTDIPLENEADVWDILAKDMRSLVLQRWEDVCRTPGSRRGCARPRFHSHE